MNRTWTKYGVLLTYVDRLNKFDPSAYEKHFKDADKLRLTDIEKQYKEYGMKHLKALMESIKQHSKTRLGQDWEGHFTAYLSCRRGFYGFKKLHESVMFSPRLSEIIGGYIKRSSRLPQPFHIHFIIEGTPGSTMAEWVRRYCVNGATHPIKNWIYPKHGAAIIWNSNV
jgi:hypothetical protein